MQCRSSRQLCLFFAPNKDDGSATALIRHHFTILRCRQCSLLLHFISPRNASRLPAHPEREFRRVSTLPAKQAQCGMSLPEPSVHLPHTACWIRWVLPALYLHSSIYIYLKSASKEAGSKSLRVRSTLRASSLVSVSSSRSAKMSTASPACHQEPGIKKTSMCQPYSPYI